MMREHFVDTGSTAGADGDHRHIAGKLGKLTFEAGNFCVAELVTTTNHQIVRFFQLLSKDVFGLR